MVQALYAKYTKPFPHCERGGSPDYSSVCWRIFVTLHYYHRFGDEHLLIMLLREVT